MNIIKTPEELQKIFGDDISSKEKEWLENKKKLRARKKTPFISQGFSKKINPEFKKKERTIADGRGIR